MNSLYSVSAGFWLERHTSATRLYLLTHLELSTVQATGDDGGGGCDGGGGGCDGRWLWRW